MSNDPAVLNITSLQAERALVDSKMAKKREGLEQSFQVPSLIVFHNANKTVMSYHNLRSFQLCVAEHFSLRFRKSKSACPPHY